MPPTDTLQAVKSMNNMVLPSDQSAQEFPPGTSPQQVQGHKLLPKPTSETPEDPQIATNSGRLHPKSHVQRSLDTSGDNSFGFDVSNVSSCHCARTAPSATTTATSLTTVDLERAIATSSSLLSTPLRSGHTTARVHQHVDSGFYV